MNLLGTKLACETCGAQVVVIKGGEGEVTCHGKPMKVVAGSMDEASRERREKGAEADPNLEL
jgi:desulfoferrodoxin